MQNFEAFRFNKGLPDGKLFAEAFLSSYDFEINILKNICRDLKLQVSGTVRDLTNRIVNSREPEELSYIVLKHLITRTKSAIAIKAFNTGNLPQCLDARQLIISPGEEQWHGPIKRDDDAETAWYIRPMLLSYKELNENAQSEEDKYIEYVIRWLCFARIADGIVSIHWHGFTYQNQDTLNPRSRAQFPYWRHIPGLFLELEKLLKTQFMEIKSHALILDTVLEQYRRNPEYYWNDDRIRAEAGGVALNARAGSRNYSQVDNENPDSEDVNVLDTEGIKYLAVTIRRAIENKLLESYNIYLPDPTEFDEEILITLIKKYGTQSYELRVNSVDDGKLFHAHCYFGTKVSSNSPDSFPHFQLKAVVDLPDLTQLKFLVNHIDRSHHLIFDEK